MQVPLIDRLNDLQVAFISLHNPSSPFQITSSLSGIQSVSVAYNFCKWAVVILALVATFGGIINRVAIFIIRLRNKAPSLHSISLDDDDYDFSASGDATSEFEDEEDEPSPSSSFHKADEYFRLTGDDYPLDDEFQIPNGSLQQRHSIGEIFSLSEIANSNSVVKLWDSIGFGLGLDFDDSDESVFSAYDINEEHGASSIPGGKPPIPAVSTASPAVVVSAGEGAHGNLALKIWDTRLRRRKPTVVAEWGPSLVKTLRVESGGVQMVYVRDDGCYGVTVGDMRNVRTPLGNVTESDADT